MAQLPKARTTDGFQKLGDYLGPSIQCKRLLLLTNNLSTEEKKQKVYRSVSAPKYIAEKKMIYTVFVMLNTSEFISGRKFGPGYVKSVRTSTQEACWS